MLKGVLTVIGMHVRVSVCVCVCVCACVSVFVCVCVCVCLPCRDDRAAEKDAMLAAAALKLQLSELLLRDMITMRKGGVFNWKKHYEQAVTLCGQVMAALAAREAGIPHIQALLHQSLLQVRDAHTLIALATAQMSSVMVFLHPCNAVGLRALGLYVRVGGVGVGAWVWADDDVHARAYVLVSLFDTAYKCVFLCVRVCVRVCGCVCSDGGPEARSRHASPVQED